MKLFTEHPRSVGENYFQHMISAATFSVRMFAGATCCLLHAIFPFLFERTASVIIAELYDRMVANRVRGPRGPDHKSAFGTDDQRRVATTITGQ